MATAQVTTDETITVASVDAEIEAVQTRIKELAEQRSAIERQIGEQYSSSDTSKFESRLATILAKLQGANAALHALKGKRLAAQQRVALARLTNAQNEQQSLFEAAESARVTMDKAKAAYDQSVLDYQRLFGQANGSQVSIDALDREVRKLNSQIADLS